MDSKSEHVSIIFNNYFFPNIVVYCCILLYSSIFFQWITILSENPGRCWAAVGPLWAPAPELWVLRRAAAPALTAHRFVDTLQPWH